MKKIKILIGFFVLIFSASTVFAQQDPQYTQYMYNMNIINPAYAGSKGFTSIGILGRTQWVGVDGAPQTATLSINGPVGKNVGLGFSVIHDEIGPVKEDNAYVDFSYTLNLSEEDKLAVSRARRVQRFLSQPFHVAEQFTGLKGVLVPIEDTIKGFNMILDGKVDEYREAAFNLVGSIEEAIEKGKKILADA